VPCFHDNFAELASATTNNTGMEVDDDDDDGEKKMSAKKKKKQTTSTAFEELIEEEIPLVLPHHVLYWKDSKQNERVAVIIHLVSGTKVNHIRVKIKDGQLVLRYTYHEYFLADDLLTWSHTDVNGVPFFDGQHVMVVALRESIQNLRKVSSDQAVEAVMRVDIDIPTKEQFTSFELPATHAFKTYVVTPQSESFKFVIYNLMGTHSNYQAAEALREEVFVTPSNRRAGAKRPSPPAAASSVKQHTSNKKHA
jgi:hypothetical protein